MQTKTDALSVVCVFVWVPSQATLPFMSLWITLLWALSKEKKIGMGTDLNNTWNTNLKTMVLTSKFGYSATIFDTNYIPRVFWNGSACLPVFPRNLSSVLYLFPYWCYWLVNYAVFCFAFFTFSFILGDQKEKTYCLLKIKSPRGSSHNLIVRA